jgi:uncharacterized membrane protein (UPF0127 family)/pimeloyl-ACP methyl ester carboxylesterase
MHIPRKRIVKILGLVVLGYCATLAVIYMGQRSMQYLPDTTNPAPAHTSVPEMQEVMVKTTDGLTLESWALIPDEPTAPVVVMFHGNAQNVAARAVKMRPLIDAGFGVVIAGYRGYGGNPGSPTENGLYTDARATLDYVLKDRAVPASRIIFYGESLGSGVATQMADEHRDIAGLILEVPFDSTLNVAKWRFPWAVGLGTLMHDQFHSDQRIQNLTMPKLFLTAGNDWIVPDRFGKALYALAPEPKKLIEYKDAGHNTLYDHGAGADIVAFIKNLPQNTPPPPPPTTAIESISSHLPIEEITIQSAGRERARVLVEVASHPKDLENGLMGRTELAVDRGMLFILPGNMIARFWMHDTLIPLDLVFIDQDGRIIKIHENAQPGDDTRISSDFPVRTVLEIPAGSAGRYGLSLGDLLISKALDQAVAVAQD